MFGERFFLGLLIAGAAAGSGALVSLAAGLHRLAAYAYGVAALLAGQLIWLGLSPVWLGLALFAVVGRAGDGRLLPGGLAAQSVGAQPGGCAVSATPAQRELLDMLDELALLTGHRAGSAGRGDPDRQPGPHAERGRRCAAAGRLPGEGSDVQSICGESSPGWPPGSVGGWIWKLKSCRLENSSTTTSRTSSWSNVSPRRRPSCTRASPT